MLSPMALNEITPSLDLCWFLSSGISGLQMHRYLFIYLFMFSSLACGILDSVPSLPVVSVQYHVFYPPSSI